MAIIDGRKLAEKIRLQLKRKIALLERKPRLGILEVGADPVVASFVKIKKKVGESLGVLIDHTHLPAVRSLGDQEQTDITTEECLLALEALCAKNDGVIVQLPLPSSVHTQTVLNAIPQQKDIDVLGEQAIFAYEARRLVFMPPVAGAVGHMLVEGNQSSFTDNNLRALVIGKGRLVGAPVATWIRLNTHWKLVVVDDTERDIAGQVKRAQVIISGAGVPGLITPDMVLPNSTLIDAGTSEQAGKLVGDIDPDCKENAFIFTPVPGGVGPVTVAVLYENLVKATELALAG